MKQKKCLLLALLVMSAYLFGCGSSYYNQATYESHPTFIGDDQVSIKPAKWFDPIIWEASLERKIQDNLISQNAPQSMIAQTRSMQRTMQAAYFAMAKEINGRRSSFVSLDVDFPTGSSIYIQGAGALLLELRSSNGDTIAIQDQGIIFYPQKRTHEDYIDSKRNSLHFSHQFNSGIRPHVISVRLPYKFRGHEIISVALNPERSKVIAPEAVATR